MSGVIALSPEFRSKPLAVGDLVRLEILLEGKHGGDGDAWKIVPPAGAAAVATPGAWIPSGTFTLQSAPLRTLTSEGDTTKLQVTALVHAPGSLATEAFQVESAGGERFDVAAGSLNQEVLAPETKEGEQAPPWILPPVAFGGWNTLLIALIAAVALAILGGLIYGLWARFGRPLKKKLDHQELAMQALQDLQKYSRTGTAIRQEEWKKFSFALAGALRRFADTNFGIDSRDMTDREFLDALRETPKGAEQLDALAKILYTIDAVRYGTKELNTSVVGELLQDSRRYVKDTFTPPAEEKKA